MKRVAVLVSTYNGERYLARQLDSLLEQEEVTVKIFVRDDGSEDRTCAILQGYAEKGLLQFVHRKNIGLGNSFMQLIYAVPDTFDYYCFCDQDDIWMKKKLYRAVGKLGTAEEPRLYVSNQILVDGQEREIGVRRLEKSDCELMRIICQNRLSGCTMLWNQALMRILKEKKFRPGRELLLSRYHDVWVSAVAAVTGEIVWDDAAYILYRQHEQNVCGGMKRSFQAGIRLMIQKIKNPYLRNGRSRICRELEEKFGEMLSRETEEIRMYAHYQDSWQIKRRLLGVHRTYTGESLTAFRVKVLFNLV